MIPVLLLAMLGASCRKPSPPEMITNERTVQAGPVRESIEGPTTWRGAGQLCVDIPASWAGTTGAAPHLLDLVHEDTDTALALRVWPWGTPVPRVPDGFTLAFHDEDSYRTVPLLHPSATYTLLSNEGRLVQGWYGENEGRVVVIEVRAPFGRTTEGRDAADDLLRSLRRCNAAAARR